MSDVPGWMTHTRGHVWHKEDDGKVDLGALDVDNHNGPMCEVCGFAFCVHCHARGTEYFPDCPGALKIAEDRLAFWRKRFAELPAELAAMEAEVARLRGEAKP